MQQEDDLRGLAKTMDFMRALSILFVVINIYWFCYGQIREWGINIGRNGQQGCDLPHEQGGQGIRELCHERSHSSEERD